MTPAVALNAAQKIPNIVAKVAAPSLVGRVLKVALALLFATLAAPFIRGLYEIARTKSFDFRQVTLPESTYKLGLGEFFGKHKTKDLETVSPDAALIIPFNELSDYQLSVLANRKEVFQEMSKDQVDTVLSRLGSTPLVRLSPDQLWEQIGPMTVLTNWACSLIGYLDPQHLRLIPISKIPEEFLEKLVEWDGLLKKMSEVQVSDLYDRAKNHQAVLLGHLADHQKPIVLDKWIQQGSIPADISSDNLDRYFPWTDDKASADRRQALLGTMSDEQLFTVFNRSRTSAIVKQLTHEQCVHLFERGDASLRKSIVESSTDQQLESLMAAHPDLLKPIIYGLEGWKRLKYINQFEGALVNGIIASSNNVNDIQAYFEGLNPTLIPTLNAESLKKVLHAAGVHFDNSYTKMEEAVRKTKKSPETPIGKFNQWLSTMREKIAHISPEKLAEVIPELKLNQWLFLLLSPDQLKATDLGKVEFALGEFYDHHRKQLVLDPQSWLLNFPGSDSIVLNNCKLTLRQLLIGQLNQLTTEQKLKLIQRADYTSPPSTVFEHFVEEILAPEELLTLPARKRLEIEDIWEEFFNKPSSLDGWSHQDDADLRKRANLQHLTPYGFLGFTSIPSVADYTLRSWQFERMIVSENCKLFIKKAQDATVAIMRQISKKD